jgi:hypothetical protein
MNWVCGCSLDHNMIRWIDTSAFKGVPKLHQLTLNNNAIKDIQRELFAGTPDDLKVPSGQIGSAIEWYHWKAL